MKVAYAISKDLRKYVVKFSPEELNKIFEMFGGKFYNFTIDETFPSIVVSASTQGNKLYMNQTKSEFILEQRKQQKENNARAELFGTTKFEIDSKMIQFNKKKKMFIVKLDKLQLQNPLTRKSKEPLATQLSKPLYPEINLHDQAGEVAIMLEAVEKIQSLSAKMQNVAISLLITKG